GLRQDLRAHPPGVYQCHHAVRFQAFGVRQKHVSAEVVLIGWNDLNPGDLARHPTATAEFKHRHVMARLFQSWDEQASLRGVAGLRREVAAPQDTHYGLAGRTKLRPLGCATLDLILMKRNGIRKLRCTPEMALVPLASVTASSAPSLSLIVWYVPSAVGAVWKVSVPFTALVSMIRPAITASEMSMTLESVPPA